MNPSGGAPIRRQRGRPEEGTVPLDACYEKVREDGVIRTVMIAIGINWDGRRSVPAVELTRRESQTSWRDFLVNLSNAD